MKSYYPRCVLSWHSSVHVSRALAVLKVRIFLNLDCQDGIWLFNNHSNWNLSVIGQIYIWKMPKNGWNTAIPSVWSQVKLKWNYSSPYFSQNFLKHPSVTNVTMEHCALDRKAKNIRYFWWNLIDWLVYWSLTYKYVAKFVVHYTAAHIEYEKK